VINKSMIGAQPETSRNLAVKVLTDAFAADPVISFLFEGLDKTHQHREWFFQYQVDDALDRHVLDVGEHAVAIWHDRCSIDVQTRARVPFDPSMVFAENTERASALSDAMLAHHPREPHWYLYFVGVQQGCEGRSFGTNLVSERLLRANTAGVACYLEATSERSASLYRRLGFQDRPTFSVPGGPVLFPMWRNPTSTEVRA
jgi:ribosomal protein S18 acetylase RimI-like enzyme